MRKINLPMLLLLALLGCSKESIRPEWTGWGDVSAICNGGKWNNTAAAVLLVKTQSNDKCSGYIDIQFYRFGHNGVISESLHLGGIPTQSTERYQLVDEAASTCGSGLVLTGYQTSDDDVRISTYSFDQTQPNYLEITSYDSTTHRIEGTFQATFDKQAIYKNGDPSRVIFADGRFSAPVNDKGRFE